MDFPLAHVVHPTTRPPTQHLPSLAIYCRLRRFWPVRPFPWGTAEGMFREHSDVPALKQLLFASSYTPLKNATEQRYYQYRRDRLLAPPEAGQRTAVTGDCIALEWSAPPAESAAGNHAAVADWTADVAEQYADVDSGIESDQHAAVRAQRCKFCPLMGFDVLPLVWAFMTRPVWIARA
jgi:septin family protein